VGRVAGRSGGGAVAAHAIEAEGLSKRYLLGERPPLAGLLGRQPREELWALRDVDLAVEQGEVLGVIGRNGAGKTTLLKLIARITEPTTGVARMRGRVGALLEVGTGFHFELTGRENVFFNGAVLGMSRRDIERRFDEIVEFAGIERFLDTPLKRYSAGMYLRLAFSVAAHLEPDIVIVDEVLAVGDAEFQRKCMQRMSELTDEGRTVLFVSHDLGAIGRLCERVLWIEQGRISADGRAEETLERYQRETIPSSGGAARTEFPEDPARRCQFLSAAVIEETGHPVSALRRDLPLRIELTLAVREQIPELDIGIVVLDRRGTPVLDGAWSDVRGEAARASPGRYRALVTVPGVLTAGDYAIRGRIASGEEVMLESELLQLRLLPRTDERHWELVRSRLLQPAVRWSVEPIAEP
jgi:ABC-type polysaccharide/polyol phosphate transport system ATPase subunit